MKKALIVLLLLAFVAGGLFAQFTVAGDIEAGLDLQLGEHYNDPMISVMAKGAGNWLGRINLNFTASNADKNAGLFVRLRAHELGLSGGGGIGDFVHTAYGWLSFMESKLTVYAGKFQNAGSPNPLIFAAKDPLFDGDALLGNSTGLLVLIRPMDMLAFSVGAVIPSFLSGANTTEAWNVVGEFGFGLYFKDMLDFLFDMSFGKKASATDVYPANDLDILFGINVKAIKGLSMIITGKITDLASFDKSGTMKFAEYFGFTGVKNLGLNLGLMQGVSGKSADKDLFFKAWLWVTYAMMEGKVIPRLDFLFGMGAKNLGAGLDWDATYHTPTYSKDDLNMAISPSVQFKLGSSTLDIGYALDFVLKDAARTKGADHHIFVNLKAAI